MPPTSTKQTTISQQFHTSSLNSDGQQCHQYQQNNKTNNYLSPSSLNSDGQQLHQHQQNKQLSLTFKFKQ